MAKAHAYFMRSRCEHISLVEGESNTGKTKYITENILLPAMNRKERCIVFESKKSYERELKSGKDVAIISADNFMSSYFPIKTSPGDFSHPTEVQQLNWTIDFAEPFAIASNGNEYKLEPMSWSPLAEALSEGMAIVIEDVSIESFLLRPDESIFKTLIIQAPLDNSSPNNGSEYSKFFILGMLGSIFRILNSNEGDSEEPLLIIFDEFESLMKSAELDIALKNFSFKSSVDGWKDIGMLEFVHLVIAGSVANPKVVAIKRTLHHDREYIIKPSL